MLFTVIDRQNQIPPNAKGRAFLIRDAWDDWFKFATQFALVYVDDERARHALGPVKIGQFGLKPGRERKAGTRCPELPQEFDALDETFFSLGQNESYYEDINALPEDLRARIYRGLNDCAFRIDIFDRASDETVMQTSLLRSITVANVRGKLQRLANGDATPTEYHFQYAFPRRDGRAPPPILEFHVLPNSQPPTNVHIVTGRNGVGKTRFLQFLTNALLEVGGEGKDYGSLAKLGDNREEWNFSSLVLVSFSAFDSYRVPEAARLRLPATIVGIPPADDGPDDISMADVPARLAGTFFKSFSACRSGLRRERWIAAVSTLSNDPLFDESGVNGLMDLPAEERKKKVISFFKRLSSGHAVVLLTISRLVELVDERTIVLLDEPEGHLHPPLLSAFVRALSDLLVKRNGMALVASHSPVVLQEVPSSCVWMLRRSGFDAAVERPSIETFGENVGSLTREVFGLEVTTCGFHRMLAEAVAEGGADYEAILERFGGHLGAEAKAILRGMIANRDLRF